jgi:uncharacterized membrane protein YhdT
MPWWYLAGSVLGLVLVKRWFETFGRHFLNLLFTAIIPLVFFTIRINCYFRKTEKAKFLIVIGVFYLRSWFLQSYGGRRFDFSIHQDIISKIPLEIVRSTGSQITIAYLVIFYEFVSKKHVGTHYFFIFLVGLRV